MIALVAAIPVAFILGLFIGRHLGFRQAASTALGAPLPRSK